MDDLKTFAINFKQAQMMARIVYDFTNSIGMKLGFDKCKVLNIVQGKIKACGNIYLKGNDVIEEMGSDDIYKYLGVIESCNIKHNEMKVLAMEKFKKKLKNVLNFRLKSELNSKNIMTAINEYVTPVLSYTFGIVNWTEQDIKDADILVRKKLNMKRMFEIKSDVDRLYTPRQMGGRGLVSVWDSFKTTYIRLAHYMSKNSNVRLQKCFEFDKTCLFSVTKRAEKFSENLTIDLPNNLNDKPLLRQAQIIAEKAKNAIQKQRYDTCLNKPQHGIYFKLLEGPTIARKLSIAWFERAHMTPQSEAHLMAAQEFALFTRWHERNILKKQIDDKCRVCHAKPETMSHI